MQIRSGPLSTLHMGRSGVGTSAVPESLHSTATTSRTANSDRGLGDWMVLCSVCHEASRTATCRLYAQYTSPLSLEQWTNLRTTWYDTKPLHSRGEVYIMGPLQMHQRLKTTRSEPLYRFDLFLEHVTFTVLPGPNSMSVSNSYQV